MSSSKGKMDIHPILNSQLASTPLHTACIGLGSNADPVANLFAAAQRLACACTVTGLSQVWESPADGCEAPNYLNAAILVETCLAESELVAVSKQIEQELGRQRSLPSPAAVTVDIDLLVYDSEVRRSSLWSRAYCAVPAAELLPELQSTETGESLALVASRLAAGTQITLHSRLLDAIKHSSATVSQVNREER